MTTQERFDHRTPHNRQLPNRAATAALFLAAVLLGNTAIGDPGDQWILPIDHKDGSGYVVWSGAGYNGATAYEYDNSGGSVGFVRIWWVLNGLSVGTSNSFPTTTEQYTLERYVPAAGGQHGYQVIESQIGGPSGEVYPYDSRIPWVGEYGDNHQYIQAPIGPAGTWVSTGLGPHTPDSTDYNAIGDDGTYMWLTSGSYLYVKWEFNFEIDFTWSALRLTQVTGTVTRPVIQSVSKSGNTITLVWSAVAGKTYQVQYKTNLTQV